MRALAMVSLSLSETEGEGCPISKLHVPEWCAGFAFVTMETEEDAERCIRHLNQQDVSAWGGGTASGRVEYCILQPLQLRASATSTSGA